MEQNEDTEKFISSLEEKHGGKIKFRTYSTWFGDSTGIVREFGVFLYQIEDTFYYEDFERENRLFGIPLTQRKKKNRIEYIKMEDSFNFDAVKKITRVSQAAAKNYCTSNNSEKQLPKIANGFNKMFSRMFTMVELNNDKILFFELIDPKKFEKLLEEK